jgi:hypothetical protein
MASARKFGIGENRYLFIGDRFNHRINYPRLPDPLGDDPVQPLDGLARQSQRDLSPP